MKKIICLFILFNFMVSSAYAVNFDSSIDESIRKEYNVEESTMTLPKLPDTTPTAMVEEIGVKHSSATGKTYTLKNGTKIKLSSKSIISDRLRKGGKVSFLCVNGFETKEKVIVPSGTMFRGTITDSHPPQLTGNGGLIELKIDEIYFNGVMSRIETKTSIANSKKVFFGNIKGKRSYWKNFVKVTTPGRKVFSATQTASAAMAAIPVVNLLSFVPFVGGAVIYTVNFVTAPVIAIFTKGASLSLPAGTQFVIKIQGDTTIKG